MNHQSGHLSEAWLDSHLPLESKMKRAMVALYNIVSFFLVDAHPPLSSRIYCN